jgi:membrane associated rhomboid family serine protease
MSITNKLILINVFLYFVSLFVLIGFGEKFFSDNVALTPSLILQGKSLWTFLTSMFSHVLFFHIFANMFSLFFIGNFLERIIGTKRFISVYLIAGLLGGIFFVLSGLIFGGIDVPGVGASGAIFGLLGVLAVLVPYSRIYLIAGPLLLILANFIINPFIPANFTSTFSLIINFLIFVMIFAIFSFNPSIRRFAIPIELPMWLLPIIAIVPLVVIGFFVDLPIGNSAHIGGLVVGLVYGFYLRKKFPRKTERISKQFR